MADPRKKFRQMVSLKKKRFQEGDFDLDLAYITDRIIAFGFPAEGRESVFRNPMSECKRFFDTFHKDHYYVYNLCIEKDRQYKAKKFYDRVAKFQWSDHNAPPLEMIPEFCQHATDWMDKDEKNVVAIHCKAGKGRTGVLICCLLLWMKKFDDPEEAMEFYGQQRTHNGKGVTIPSQKRFIRYFRRTMTEGIPPKHTTSLLEKVTVYNISMFEDSHFSIKIESNGTIVKNKKKGDKGLVYVYGEDSVTLDLGVIPVSGNTKITILKPGKKKELLVHFWFHCHYMKDPIFRMEKNEIDKAVSDKTHKIFPEDFAIEVAFQPVQIYEGEDNQLVQSGNHTEETPSADKNGETKAELSEGAEENSEDAQATASSEEKKEQKEVDGDDEDDEVDEDDEEDEDDEDESEDAKDDDEDADNDAASEDAKEDDNESHNDEENEDEEDDCYDETGDDVSQKGQKDVEDSDDSPKASPQVTKAKMSRKSSLLGLVTGKKKGKQ